MPTAIQIQITAEDRASQVLGNVRNQLQIFDQFGRQVSDLSQKTEPLVRSFNNVDISVSKLTRGVRGLAAPLLYELSPALGGTATGLASVVTSAALLSSGIGALTLAAVGVAGVLGGRLVQSYRDAAAAAEAFERAVRVGDVNALTGAVTKQAEEVLALSRAYSELEDTARRARAAESGPEGGGGAASFFAAEGGGRLGASQRGLADRQRALDLARGAREEAEALLQADQDLKRIEEDRARLRAANAQADRGLGLGRLEPIDREFRQTMLAAEARAEADPAGAARLRQEAARQRDFALTKQRREQAIARGAALAADELDLSGVPRIYGTEQDVALQRAREQRGLELAAGEPDLSRIPRIFGTEQDVALAEKAAAAHRRRIAAAVGLLDVRLQHAEVSGQLTPELEAQVAHQQALVILTDTHLIDDERRLVLAQANLATLESMAKLDPLQGLITGFSRVANESRKLGTELERFALETDSAMTRTFSDGFFQLFTGKKGQDLGKQFGESLLRSFSDVLGRQLSGAASGLFAQALGGLRGAAR